MTHFFLQNHHLRLVLCMYLWSNLRWRFRKILWPSQNMYMNFNKLDLVMPVYMLWLFLSSKQSGWLEK